MFFVSIILLTLIEEYPLLLLFIIDRELIVPRLELSLLVVLRFQATETSEADRNRMTSLGFLACNFANDRAWL